MGGGLGRGRGVRLGGGQGGCELRISFCENSKKYFFLGGGGRVGGVGGGGGVGCM